MRRHEEGLQLLEGLKRNESEYNSGSPNILVLKIQNPIIHIILIMLKLEIVLIIIQLIQIQMKQMVKMKMKMMQQKGTAPLIAALSSGGVMRNRKETFKRAESFIGKDASLIQHAKKKISKK